MSSIAIASIVEGHGEVQAVGTLLARIGRELLGADHVLALPPMRVPRDKILQKTELGKYVELARRKLAQIDDAATARMILILVDADREPPCVLGPRLQEFARRGESDALPACVVANVEYETWFVAAAVSLAEFLTLSADDAALRDPEKSRSAKRWIQDRLTDGLRYSETFHQPRMTRAMDLKLCRNRSPSFDKLCRELAKRLN